MKNPIKKRILLLSSLLCLLVVGQASFAADQAAPGISDDTLVDECTYMGCDGWDCIYWGKGDDQRFCWCTWCDDASAAGAVYQVGPEQYLCAPNKTGGNPRCVPYPVQVKVVDPQNIRMEGKDKAAVDEIFRMKAQKASGHFQMNATTEITAPIQQPSKTISPIFRKTAPVGR